MKKTKKMDKKLIIVIVALIAIIAVVVVIFNLTKEENYNKDGADIYTQYDYITSIINKYNEENKESGVVVSLDDSEDDIIVTIAKEYELTDEYIYIPSMDYTSMKINCVVHDSNKKVVKLLNITIDDNFNILSVFEYMYKTGEVNNYNKEDNEIEQYKIIADTMKIELNKMFKDTIKDGVVLYNKDISQLKQMEYKK